MIGDPCNKKPIHAWIGGCICAVLGLWSVEASAYTAIMITGTLVASPSCTVNDDKDIQVDFGKAVDIDLIVGKAYEIKLPIVITCKNLTNKTQTVKIIGPLADSGFKAGTLRTTDINLGIKITRAGYDYTPGDNIEFEYPTYFPPITVILVKSTKGAPSPGVFSSNGNVLLLAPL